MEIVVEKDSSTVNDKNWREWNSLANLIKRIPQQFQYGFHVAPLKLTCIDAFLDNLAIGTNVGLVYIAHLPSFNLMRLKCEDVTFPITCISAVGSVDDMIAVGCENGSISIFQLPSSIPVPKSSQITEQQDLYRKREAPKRFTVNIHTCSLTSLKWSKNGLRLFSGDMNGNVGVIELDYEKYECIGKLILKVESQVVQLSYIHQLLAISFKERCIIYDFKEQQTIVVGKKPRNPPGKFGCTFATSIDTTCKDILYCARPGKKIWSAASDGNVIFSYIHKKSPEESVIKILKTRSNYNARSSSSVSDGYSTASFGLLHHIKDSVIVSYSESYLIILDVQLQKVLGYSDYFTKICDVTVCDNNIFILDDYKNIICLSQCDTKFGENILSSNMSQSLHENLNLSTLSEMTSKVMIPKKQLIDGITKFSETVASKFSEIANPTIISGNIRWPDNFSSNSLSNHGAQCSPAIVNLDQNPQPAFQESDFSLNSKHKIPDCAAFEERVNCTQIIANEKDIDTSNLLVMHHHSKKKSKKKSVNDGSESLEKLKITCEDDGNVTVVAEVDGVTGESQYSHDDFHLNNFSYGSHIGNDLKKNIEEKEKVLASVLNLNCLKMDHEEVAKNSIDNSNESSFCPNNNEDNNLINAQDEDSQHESFDDHPKDLEELLNEQDSLNSSITSYKFDSGNLSYGPPSGSSVPNFSIEISQSTEGCFGFSLVGDEMRKEKDRNNLIRQKSKEGHFPSETLSCGWFKYYLPGCAFTLGSNKSTLCFTDNYDIYFSASSSETICHGWQKRKLPVVIQQFYHSNNEQTMLIQTADGLFKVEELFSVQPLKFTFVESDIQWASNNDGALWILNSSGSLIVQASTIENEFQRNLEVSCPEPSMKCIVSHNGVIWALLSNGTLVYRIGVNSSFPAGFAWGFLPSAYPIKCIHLSNHGFGWIINAIGQIFFKVMIEMNHPQGADEQWWQAEQSDFMMVSDEFLITSTEHHLWICDKGSNYMFAHSLASLSGHCWNKVLGEKFTSLCAEGMYKSYGVLLSTIGDKELRAIYPTTNIITVVDIPTREKIACISSRPEAIWLLTEKGNIFIRTGISSNSSLGNAWTALDLREIADIQLVHLSLGADVVWAVDEMGKVYMRQGPLNPPSKKGLAPGWLHVESTELQNGAIFSKVFVGNKLDMVWGIDSSCRIYVREAIFQELSTGTSWVFVPGMIAKSITISEDRVFVLTPYNKTFERIGVSSTNYIGDSWKKIPMPSSTTFAAVTVSVDNYLWGLCTEGHVWKHKHQTFIYGSPISYSDSDGISQKVLPCSNVL